MNRSFTLLGVIVIQFAYCGESRAGRSSDEIIRDHEKDIDLAHDFFGIPKIDGTQQTPATAEEINSILARFGNRLLRGDDGINNFTSLSSFCNLIVNSPDGKTALPRLYAALKDLSPPKLRLDDQMDWEQHLVRVRGGRLGLVIDCILNVSGREGFEQIVQMFERQNEPDKMRILFERVVGRADFESYVQTWESLKSQAQEAETAARLKRDLPTFLEVRREYLWRRERH